MYLNEYTQKILKNDITGCLALKKCLSNLQEDLNNPLFSFDTTEAHKRIKFIESECKHSIAPFAGKPFILELWQKAFLEACFSFYMEIDGQKVRRFNRGLLLVARKNGKSTLAAGECNAEFFCGNWGIRIVCASNDYAQCDIIYDEINNMREASPRLRKCTHKVINKITMGNRKQKKRTGKFTIQNKAKITKLSSGTGAKEGGNIDLGIVDEIHEMKDASLINPIIQSTSTKDECLIIEITTEGFTEDGYLDKRKAEGRRILNGEIDRPRELIWIYEQDSEEEIWQDESSWIKSNPNLGVSKKLSYLRQIVEEAKTDNEKKAYMLAKDFNLKQNSATAWLNIDDILNDLDFKLSDFRGHFYIGGMDFAETTDLMSASFLFKRVGDKMIYIHTHYWIPKTKLENKADYEDGARYEEWIQDGHLTVVDDISCASSLVADYEYNILYKIYGCTPYRCGYDNRFAKDYKARHEEIYGEKLTENVQQSFENLSTPMREMGEYLKLNLVNYQQNKVDIWCFKNTGIKIDDKKDRRFCMPCKLKTTKRIDGTASKINCFCVYRNHKNEFDALLK